MHRPDQSPTKDVAVSPNEAELRRELAALRANMERELARRNRLSFLTSTIVLGVSIIVAVIGLGSAVNFDSLLGEWRYGVITLAGAAFLFSYTIWLHFALEHRSKASTSAYQLSLDHEPAEHGTFRKSRFPG